MEARWNGSERRTVPVETQGSSRDPIEDREDLDMRRVREHVYRGERRQSVSGVSQQCAVSSETGDVAAYEHHPACPGPGCDGDSGPAETVTARVCDHKIGSGRLPLLKPAPYDLDREPGKVLLGVGNRRLRNLYRRRRPARFPQHPCEHPDTAA